MPAWGSVEPGFIGVFDSGIGGLSVLRALRARLPAQRYVYVADSAHAPYGERGDAYVIQRTMLLTRWLVEQGASLVVNACNTATAAAAKLQRQTWPTVPLVAIEPAIKPAAQLSHSAKVSVMATRGTLQSEKFASLLSGVQAQCPQVSFQLLPCDGLAEAIERQSEIPDREAILRCSEGPIQRILSHGSDVVVLGCTHYPLVQDWLAEQLPVDTNWVDPAPSVAQQAERQMATIAAQTARASSLQLFTTGHARLLQAAARRWLAEDLLVQTIQL
jgi:glutamate racemase